MARTQIPATVYEQIFWKDGRQRGGDPVLVQIVQVALLIDRQACKKDLIKRLFIQQQFRKLVSWKNLNV